MAIVCFFGIILGVCALYAELADKRFEECLPLASCSVIAVLYAAGLAGKLAEGVWAAVALAAVSGLSALILALCRRHLRKWAGSLFTPGMAIYVALCAAVYVANAGKPIKGWDEFSYWADAVKIMTQQGVLPSDPVGRSLFASYPPALPLWEYLLQRLHFMISGTLFDESMLFMSYQWLMFALYMPFVAHLKWRRPLEWMVCGAVIPLVALSVNASAYNELYSDVLLGTIGGFAAAYPFCKRKMDPFDWGTQMAVLFVLVLVKDAGLLFAIAGVVSAGLSVWRQSEKGFKRFLPVLLCGMAAAAARLSWSVHVNAVGAAAQESFDQPIRLGLLLQPDQHWRITTLRNFIYRFFEADFTVKGIGIQISYFLLFVVLAAVFAVLYLSVKNRETACRIRGLAAVTLGSAGVYIAGMGVAYLFKFYEDEAVRLASYARYMNIAVMMIVFALFACLVQMRRPLWEHGIGRRTAAGMLAFFMLFVPVTSALNAVSRFDAQTAQISQSRFLALEQKVFSVADEDDRVYLIAAGSKGYERLIMRYRLRPMYVGDEPWNIGIGVEEDRFTSERTVEDFRKCLIEKYDLLVICALNDEFSRTYAELFEEPETLAEGQVYRVNAETGLLQLAE